MLTIVFEVIEGNRVLHGLYDDLGNRVDISEYLVERGNYRDLKIADFRKKENEIGVNAGCGDPECIKKQETAIYTMSRLITYGLQHWSDEHIKEVLNIAIHTIEENIKAR